MEVVNKCELKLENYNKCFLLCDSDCPLGQLFDYTSALQAFIISKMQIAQEASKPKEEPKVE